MPPLYNHFLERVILSLPSLKSFLSISHFDRRRHPNGFHKHNEFSIITENSEKIFLCWKLLLKASSFKEKSRLNEIPHLNFCWVESPTWCFVCVSLHAVTVCCYPQVTAKSLPSTHSPHYSFSMHWHVIQSCKHRYLSPYLEYGMSLHMP